MSPVEQVGIIGVLLTIFWKVGVYIRRRVRRWPGVEEMAQVVWQWSDAHVDVNRNWVMNIHMRV